MHKILIIYYSRSGAVAELARHIATGVESVGGCEAVVRTLPPVSTVNEAVEDELPTSGDGFATLEDLQGCDGLIIGSPTRFGGGAAALKYFLEQSGGLWQSGVLCGKPGAAFTSSSSMHGGQESTLLTMLIPLLHHGMVVVGIPFAKTALAQTTRGGTPYGASHVSGVAEKLPIDKNEKDLAQVLGKRVAQCAHALKNASLQ